VTSDDGALAGTNRTTFTVVPVTSVIALENGTAEISLSAAADAVIEVRVYGNAMLNAADIDTGRTYLLAGTGTKVRRRSALDVTLEPGDAIPDRVFTFSRNALVAAGGLSIGTNLLVLSGLDLDGASFQATLEVAVVP
jgi:hypothetical protein